MNRDVERYLGRATRGLWGKKKLEVKEEVMVHIEGRLNAHLVGGMDEEAAIQKTLTDLGDPRHVSAGMTKLHTAPTLMALATVMSIIALTVFALLTGGVAQSLPGTFYWPSEMCLNVIQEGKISGDMLQDFLNRRYDDSCLNVNNSLWLDFDALKPLLETEGIEVEISGSRVNLSFAENETVAFYLGESGIHFSDDESETMRLNPSYFDFWELVKSVAGNPNIPLKISGWENPTVEIGGASFQIGTDEQPFRGADFYDHYLERVLFKVTSQIPGDYVDLVNPRIERLAKGRAFYGNDWHEALITKASAHLNVQKTSGIYGVIAILDLDNPLAHQPADYGETIENDSAFYMALARADADGSVTLELPSNESIEFVNSLNQNPEPGKAVLVELSVDAGSWFKIIAPENIRLEFP